MLHRALLWIVGALLIATCSPALAGRDEKIVNPNPNKLWSRTAGGVVSGAKSVGVVIALSDYKGGGYPPLPTARNDAQKMINFLIGDAGFDVVFVLTDEEVTKQRIERLMLDEVRRNVDRNDRVLVYWSGHGDQLIVGEAKFGFLPLVNSKRDQFSGMVSMDDLARWNAYIGARQSLFLLDACLSGLAGSEVKSARDDRVKQLSGVAHHVLTAGTAGENAITGEQWTGSLFTDSFIKGAQGEASSTDGVVSLWALLEYIQRRVLVERTAARWGNTLTPQIRFLSAGPGAFFFTPNPGPVAGVRNNTTASRTDKGATPVPPDRPAAAPTDGPQAKTGAKAPDEAPAASRSPADRKSCVEAAQQKFRSNIEQLLPTLGSKLVYNTDAAQYFKRGRPKAFALCIDWKKSTPDERAGAGFGFASSVSAGSATTVDSTALGNCALISPDRNRSRCCVIVDRGEGVKLSFPPDWPSSCDRVSAN
jgi:hypothetical protein